jgi:hypothetical protein
VEVGYTTTKKHDNLSPTNQYTVLFGVSTRVRGAAASRTPARTAGRWRTELGTAGGYFYNHHAGGTADLTGFTLPGIGNTFFVATGGGQIFAAPPSLFAIFPLGEKFALEPGFDAQRIQVSGTTGFSGNLSARINYAVRGGWYAAAGGNLNYLKVSTVDAGTVTGANVAWGYRFPLGRSFGGRAEVNYTMMGDNTDLGVVPQNVLGVMLGVTVPLK